MVSPTQHHVLHPSGYPLQPGQVPFRGIKQLRTSLLRLPPPRARRPQKAVTYGISPEMSPSYPGIPPDVPTATQASHVYLSRLAHGAPIPSGSPKSA
jgi:hypothetical protein